MRWLLVVVALGCGGEPESEPSEPEPAPAHVDEEEADEQIEEADEPLDLPPPPVLDEAALDSMEERDLEAACFAGSTAACDRLGH